MFKRIVSYYKTLTITQSYSTQLLMDPLASG